MTLSIRQTSRSQITLSALLGLVAGLLVGYIFIGSVDKVLRVNAEESYQLQHTQSDGRKNKVPTTATQKPQGFLKSGRTIHVLCTSNGSPYLNFQTRILFGTYQLVKEMPGGENLVAFTRILHRTKPDVLVDEVPTFRAEPLTPQCDGWCEFPVSDRPNAVAQFFKAAVNDSSMIKAPWVLMLEGDYVWMKPLQAPLAESNEAGWAFPYSYISPANPAYTDIMRIMFPASAGSLTDIPNSGPAPVLLRVQDWIKLMPDWERLTAHIEAHEETKTALGWVREMYAWSIAAALQKVKVELKRTPESPLMAQPPEDHKQGAAALLHYTWGILVEDSKKTSVWKFDKRDYVAPEIERKSPKIPLPPPFDPQWRLHEGQKYDLALHNLTVAMLTQMNKAIDRLPELVA